MQVLLFGTMKLLQEYRRVEGKETRFTVFGEWQADQECSNLKLVSLLNLNYMLAIQVFKVGCKIQ